VVKFVVPYQGELEMIIRFHELSLDDARLDELRPQIAEYWSQLWDCENSGGTTWDVLEEIGQQVTECLERGFPEEVFRALELTAKAEFLRRAGGDGS